MVVQYLVPQSTEWCPVKGGGCWYLEVLNGVLLKEVAVGSLKY